MINNTSSIPEEYFIYQTNLNNLSTNTNISYQNQLSQKLKGDKIFSLFQTTKKAQKINSQYKKQVFERNFPQIKTKKEENQFKSNYLDLLISSLDSQLEKGEITLDYLYSKTIKYDFDLTLFENNNYSKKCENKTCAIIADDPSKIFQSKFYSSSSYKSQTLNLCEKCYEAYKKGNYCYYCNIIYRDFDFNTSYYDKKKWIQCDYCLRWEHMQCEEKKGKYYNVEQLALNPNFKYMCPFCRKDNDKIIKELSKKKKKKVLCKKRYKDKSNNISTCEDNN
jgi:hypothetical protein